MRRLASVLFLAAAALAAPPWRAAGTTTTNGERLARNLPPLPPKYGRTLPGHARAVDDPTHVQVARASASPSHPVPPVILTGRIEVRSLGRATHSTNNTLGFLENTGAGVNGINPGAAEDRDLHVSFQTTASGKGPFDIIAGKPRFKGPVYLGGESSNPSPVLSASSGATVDFRNVEQTPPRSRPVKGSTGTFEESSIWSIHPQTKQITAHWINPDGTAAPTLIAYDARENVIFFTGNIDKYNQESHAPASLVEFFLASD